MKRLLVTIFKAIGVALAVAVVAVILLLQTAALWRIDFEHALRIAWVVGIVMPVPTFWVSFAYMREQQHQADKTTMSGPPFEDE